jgi:hypothetical protein
MEEAASKDEHANEAGHILKSGRQGCVDKETEQKKKMLRKGTPGNYYTFYFRNLLRIWKSVGKQTLFL